MAGQTWRLLVLVALPACVSDAPTGADGGADGGGNDATSDVMMAGEASDGMSAADSGCMAPTTQCGASCVNLDTDKDNCGACSHACTSRTCAGGKCSYQTVFVLGGTTAGTLGGNLGGLAGADQACQTAAMAATLRGKYMAWLSAGGASPSTRFTVKSTNPYTLVDQTKIANNWTDLTNGDIAHIIDRDAQMMSLTNNPHLVMTNTKGDGTSMGGPDCGGWTNGTMGTHTGGATNTQGVGWTENGYTNGDCSMAIYNLYCFEQ